MAGNRADSIAGWSNLSALGCLIVLVMWFVTTGLPGLMSQWEAQQLAMRVDFKEVVSGLVAESKSQRADFRDELTTHRQQSLELATGGHESVALLSMQVAELKELIVLRTEQLSE